jgi:hypothetical protein
MPRRGLRGWRCPVDEGLVVLIAWLELGLLVTALAYVVLRGRAPRR